MSAYIIVEIEITDPMGYEEYKKLAGPTVEQHGGKYIVRGGACEMLEGDWNPKRIVILQFENVGSAAKPGSIAQNTPNRAKCAIAPPRRG